MNPLRALRALIHRRSAPPLPMAAYEEFVASVEKRHRAQARDLARLRALRTESALIRQDESTET